MCYVARNRIPVRSFRDAYSRELPLTGRNRRWPNIAKAAVRKLDMLDAAQSLIDLLVPPANHLEALQGDRAGQHSIRTNSQFRICFRWTDAGPEETLM